MKYIYTDHIYIRGNNKIIKIKQTMPERRFYINNNNRYCRNCLKNDKCKICLVALRQIPNILKTIPPYLNSFTISSRWQDIYLFPNEIGNRI